MFRYFVRRLLQMVLTFFGATFVVYALMFANQTDPIQALVGERPITASQRAAGSGLVERHIGHLGKCGEHLDRSSRVARLHGVFVEDRDRKNFFLVEAFDIRTRDGKRQ